MRETTPKKAPATCWPVCLCRNPNNMKKLQDHSQPTYILRDAATYLGIRFMTLCDMVRDGAIEACLSPYGYPVVLIAELDRYIAKRAGIKR